MLIFGSGETAKLAKFYFDTDHESRPKVFSEVFAKSSLVDAFTVDDEYAKEDKFDGLKLYPFSQASNNQKIHVALSYKHLNKLREAKFNQCKEAGFELVSYISSKAAVFTQDIGKNAFILENNVIQPGVKIGDNCMLWSGNHIGHGSRIGNHTYISSHVVICGNCTIGERNFFGVNSSIKDFTTIGNDCFITMGAIVTKDMPDGSVAIDRDIITGEKAQKIRDKYFGS